MNKEDKVTVKDLGDLVDFTVIIDDLSGYTKKIQEKVLQNPSGKIRIPKMNDGLPDIDIDFDQTEKEIEYMKLKIKEYCDEMPKNISELFEKLSKSFNAKDIFQFDTNISAKELIKNMPIDTSELFTPAHTRAYSGYSGYSPVGARMIDIISDIDHGAFIVGDMHAVAPDKTSGIFQFENITCGKRISGIDKFDMAESKPITRHEGDYIKHDILGLNNHIEGRIAIVCGVDNSEVKLALQKLRYSIEPIASTISELSSSFDLLKNTDLYSSLDFEPDCELKKQIKYAESKGNYMLANDLKEQLSGNNFNGNSGHTKKRKTYKKRNKKKHGKNKK